MVGVAAAVREGIVGGWVDVFIYGGGEPMDQEVGRFSWHINTQEAAGGV